MVAYTETNRKVHEEHDRLEQKCTPFDGLVCFHVSIKDALPFTSCATWITLNGETMCFKAFI